MANTAPRWAAWEAAGRPVAFAGTTTAAVTFPTSPLTIRAWLALDADPTGDPTSDLPWSTEITSYIRFDPQIIIRRGQSGEQSETEPASCELTLDNTDGRFTPRNPMGAWYGQIGRNTPIRIQIDPGSGPITRFSGYVSEWPPTWDPSGVNITVPITAAGVLRRLSQGHAVIRSAMTAGILTNYPAAVAFWPCEDGASATTAASLVSTVDPMRVAGTVDFAGAGSLPPGLAAAPDLTAGRLIGHVVGTSATAWSCSFAAAITGDASILTVATTTGKWTVDSSSGTVRLRRAVGSTVTTATSVTQTVTDGDWRAYAITLTQSGADILVTLDVYPVGDPATGAGSGATAGATVSTATLARVLFVTANPLVSSLVSSVAQIAVGDSTTILGVQDFAMSGNVPATTAERAAELSTELGVAIDVEPVTDAFYYAGPRSSLSAVEVLRDCEQASGGLLIDRADGRLGLDLGFRAENQGAAMTLSYTSGQIQPPLEPVDDDRLTANRVTVNRRDGSPATVTETTGTLGTATVGVYDQSYTAALARDVDTVALAGWYVTRGTVDEARYPTVRIALHRSPELIPYWLACDVGSRITLTGLPTWLSYDGADLLLIGYTETVDTVSWTVDLACRPYWPNRIAVAAADTGDTQSFMGYAVPDSCVLASAVDSTSTSLSVTTTGALWSTTADDYSPVIDIVVEGERMTVSAASGASNPQTLTVARSTNGVVKSHVVNASVALVYPGVAGL